MLYSQRITHRQSCHYLPHHEDAVLGYNDTPEDPARLYFIRETVELGKLLSRFLPDRRMVSKAGRGRDGEGAQARTEARSSHLEVCRSEYWGSNKRMRAAGVHSTEAQQTLHGSWQQEGHIEDPRGSR